MKTARDALKHLFRSDPIMIAQVGYHDDGIPKIHEMKAPPDTQPPYYVWFMMPMDEPEGHFGDIDAIQRLSFQISSWGRTPDEAWKLSDAVQDAADHGDISIELIPYDLLFLRKMGGGRPFRDEDTDWVQIPDTYRLSVAR